jgi:hypothetical protein
MVIPLNSLRRRHANSSLWGPPSLKPGKGSKHCTQEHCKARTKAGGRTNTPQEALRISSSPQGWAGISAMFVPKNGASIGPDFKVAARHP